MSKRSNNIGHPNEYACLDLHDDAEIKEALTLLALILDVPKACINLFKHTLIWDHHKSEFSIHKENESITPLPNSNSERIIISNLEKSPELINESLKNYKFYASTPFIVDKRESIGVLYILDTTAREFSNNDVKIFEFFANKLMGYFNFLRIVDQKNKILTQNNNQLIKLTQNIPEGIFQLKVVNEKKYEYEFISQGIKDLIPDIDIEGMYKDFELSFKYVYPDDVQQLINTIDNSIAKQLPIYAEYRVLAGKKEQMLSVKAVPEVSEDGTLRYFGRFSNISHVYNYKLALDDITQNISHILRRPITTLQSLVDYIEDDEVKVDPKEVTKVINFIRQMVDELEQSTRQLNRVYQNKKKEVGDAYNGEKQPTSNAF